MGVCGDAGNDLYVCCCVLEGPTKASAKWQHWLPAVILPEDWHPLTSEYRGSSVHGGGGDVRVTARSKVPNRSLESGLCSLPVVPPSEAVNALW